MGRKKYVFKWMKAVCCFRVDASSHWIMESYCRGALSLISTIHAFIARKWVLVEFGFFYLTQKFFWSINADNRLLFFLIQISIILQNLFFSFKNIYEIYLNKYSTYHFIIIYIRILDFTLLYLYINLFVRHSFLYVFQFNYNIQWFTYSKCFKNDMWW